LTNSADNRDFPIRAIRGDEASSMKRVLHVVVGHGLRTYFLNAVRSVRMVAPSDEILVVDNASPDLQLRRELTAFAKNDPKARLLLRDSNDLANGKVGGLYEAYRDAFALAMEEGFDYVHLVQGDMQVLWWDSDVVSRATAIFESDEHCVNVFTCLLSTDLANDAKFQRAEGGNPPRLLAYGLTDTGLYDLQRWKKLGMSFDDDELIHAKKYLSQGFNVTCHPWPTDAQIPWPAVVRKGVQQGKEIRPVKPFLLKPMSASGVEEVKNRDWTWLEEACIPWGWTCLSPMWTTHLNAAYLANRRLDWSTRGFQKSRPRWERRGLDSNSWRSVLLIQHRPSLVKLLIVVPTRELLTRVKNRKRKVI
jgi:hypothetical protein